MKKLSLIALFVGLLVLGTNVKAMTEAQLKEKLFQTFEVGGKDYTLSDDQKIIVERYLEKNEISETDADTIWTKVQKALNVIKGQGNTNFTKYPQSVKNELKDIVEEISTETKIKATLTKEGLEVKNSDGSTVIIDTPVKRTGYETSKTAIIAGLSILIVAVGTCLVIKQVKTSE